MYDLIFASTIKLYSSLTTKKTRFLPRHYNIIWARKQLRLGQTVHVVIRDFFLMVQLFSAAPQDSRCAQFADYVRGIHT